MVDGRPIGCKWREKPVEETMSNMNAPSRSVAEKLARKKADWSLGFTADVVSLKDFPSSTDVSAVSVVSLNSVRLSSSEPKEFRRTCA